MIFMAGKRIAQSRGFFFTVMALAMLMLMLLSVQVWVRTFEQQDSRATQKFKGEAMRLSLSTLSDSTLSKFANASAFYATYKLVNFTSQPGKALFPISTSDTGNPSTERVPQVIKELMLNGSSIPIEGDPSSITYSDEEKDSYALSSWLDKIAAAAEVMGLNASFSSQKNFSFRQVSAWDLNVQFEVEMNISDREGTMRQNKVLKANATFPIDGFLDPLIRRSDAVQRCNSGSSCINFSERQFFRNVKYDGPDDLEPDQLILEGRVTEGYGWFYGPVVDEYPTNFSADEIASLSQYMLVHEYDESMTIFADSYGAVIMTNKPEEISYIYTPPGSSEGCEYNVTQQVKCLNCYVRYTPLTAGCPGIAEQRYNNVTKPYMAIDGTDWLSGVKNVDLANVSDFKYVLMDNEFLNPADIRVPGAYHRIWDMTALRDATICGFYVKSEKGPSFFQRMVQQGADTLTSPAFGLETFVIGRWAGGADDKDDGHPDFSRLDHEFYNREGVRDDSLFPRIMGMPGCKSYEMCSNDPNVTELGVGIFRVSDDAAGRYGMDGIRCTSEHCG